MAQAETNMTIKLSSEEFKALQKLLSFQYKNSNINFLPSANTGMKDREKDLLNGIFFEMNSAQANTQ